MSIELIDHIHLLTEVVLAPRIYHPLSLRALPSIVSVLMLIYLSSHCSHLQRRADKGREKPHQEVRGTYACS